VIAAIDSLVAAGERDAAVELMMAQIVGLPAEALGQLRADPAAWQPMVDSVHTLPREFRSVDEFRFDAADTATSRCRRFFCVVRKAHRACIWGSSWCTMPSTAPE
jgi:hypothetical protein